MSASSPTVVHVLASASTDAAVVASRCASLCARGVDAHVVVAGDHVRTLPGDVPAARIHLSAAHAPRGLARAAIPRAVARSLAANPRGVWRWTWAGGRLTPALAAGHAVEAVLLALRPGVIHFDDVASAARYLRVREIVGSRVVVTVDEAPEQVDTELRPAYRAVIAEADALHVPDDLVWQRLRSRAPRITAAPPRLTTRRPVGRTDAGDNGRRTLRILSVAPLTWAHGFEWALQAIRLALDAGVECEYRIVGTGRELDALCFARYQLDLEAYVDLRERSSGEERVQLEWPDVYLDSAVAWASGGMLADALAAGIPAVATDRARLPAGSQRAVFAVPRRDPAAIAERVAVLARDTPLRRRMGELARRSMAGGPGIEAHVEELERAYRRLAAA